MSAGTLPDLLEALGELFICPGARPGPPLAAVRDAGWAGPALRSALDQLLAAPADNLDIAYASLFLARTGRPTIRLGASASRTGLHQDPEIRDRLEPIYRAAGISPDTPSQPDDLGCLLILMAHLLRLLASGRADLEIPLVALYRDPIEPLVRSVARQLAEPGVPPFHAAAGATLDIAMQACEGLLQPA